MEITTLCAVVASLGLFPNRSQFFQYESVSFSMNCGQQGDTSGWRVKRNTSRRTNQDCPSSWDRKSKFYCYFDCLYEADSGVYWCESEAEKCINAINITVTAGALILEIPALPVMEGEAVTLQCRTMMALAETLITEFYKDEVLIGSSSTGNITLHSVTKLDEGLYKCNIPGIGESPKSWLSVRAGLPELLHSAPAHIILPVMSTIVLLILLMLLCLWRNYKDNFNSTVVLYTEITCKQKCKTKGQLDTRRSSSFSSVVSYRPVFTSAQVWVYKADRRHKGKT
ncbi:low affinity immunoglobulin gamma Fc region receptor II-a [Kryptolebias marmoratus]|uniref:low affinity immunoglobulin gamma Fc region receptor II-a n=1 Tax=Kryptolebias marmoratus TaxID=37003 RepID=UPI000D5310DE|nr:low affinity immunoglobulin gamma Fc region receptor II-a [Kryptolebias marmoratus]